ncbi:hypothetical protein NXS19_013447 [Fusarium pseudograminearum]|nr:hypothetical protein NXS19_013447 [Fusarium pseudograminearum]
MTCHFAVVAADESDLGLASTVRSAKGQCGNKTTAPILSVLTPSCQPARDRCVPCGLEHAMELSALQG